MITAKSARQQTNETLKNKSERANSYLEGEILAAVNKGLSTVTLYPKDYDLRELLAIATQYGYTAQISDALDQRNRDSLKIIW